MITIDYLQSQFYNGQFEECLENLTSYLLFNSNNAAALLLKAKCSYELANFSATDEDFIDAMRTALDNFKAAVDVDPANEEALGFSVYISLYFLEENLSETLYMCDELEKSENQETQLKALYYKTQVHLLLNNSEKSLTCINECINLSKKLYADNRCKLDENLNEFFLKKAHIYLQLENDEIKALQSYKDGFQYAIKNREIDLFITKLAFEKKDYDFALAIFESGLLNGFCRNLEMLQKLSLYTKNLLEDGFHNEKLFFQVAWSMLIIQGEILRNEQESKNVKLLASDQTVDIFNLSMKYMKLYPEWASPYHFLGKIYFEAENYTEAYPYLQKSLEKGVNTGTIFRYIKATYYLTGEVPELETINWVNDTPNSYYSFGVEFHEFENEIRNNYNRETLSKLREKFYEKSYNTFYEYFFENKHTNLSNETHLFAMCCNNYGMALTENGNPEKALEIHDIGYSLSPFWEQLISKADALVALERHDEAIEALNKVISYGFDYLDFAWYIQTKAAILESTYKLNKICESEILLKEIEEEYLTFLDENQNDLDKEELNEIASRYIAIQNVRSALIDQATDPYVKIEAWNKQLQKMPDDSTAYYTLFQLYYEIKDYKNTIACVQNYISVKGTSILARDLIYARSYQGRAKIKLTNYAEGIEILENLFTIEDDGYKMPPETELHTYRNLTIGYFELQDWVNCRKNALTGLTCYDRNSWSYDDETTELQLYFADSCIMLDLTDEAFDTIQNILDMAPDNEEALKRKKEWNNNSIFAAIFGQKWD